MKTVKPIRKLTQKVCEYIVIKHNVKYYNLYVPFKYKTIQLTERIKQRKFKII